MAKESISSNLYSSSSIPKTSTSLRWMPRFMWKSSPLICIKSTPTFSVASITKAHTFGKLKQQNGNSNNSRMDSGLANTSGVSSGGSHQARQRHHQNSETIGNNQLYIDGAESILIKLPMEVVQDILIYLDCLTLHQLCLSSSAFRRLLPKTTAIWRTVTVDSKLPSNHQKDSLELYKMIFFMVTNGTHIHVNSLILDRCAFLDPPLLDTLVRAFPNLVRLSLVQCPQIGCWQILYMLRASIKDSYQLQMLEKQHQTLIDCESDHFLTALKAIKQPQQQKSTSPKAGLSYITHSLSSAAATATTNETSATRSSSTTRGHGLLNNHHHQHTQTTDRNNNTVSHHILLPCLKHLTELNMEGAFPSERSYKSHTHEMYCFGEIKKALLQLGHDNGNMAPTYQQLSEAHYALYQFWLLLRSHMLRWDSGGQETQTQQQQHHTSTVSQQQQWQDFRPPWLPDTLVQFIQITEQDNPSSPVKIDLAPCPLCHRNVAPPSQVSQSLCYACHSPTPLVCAQCRCHSCHAVLCSRCHQTHQTRFRQSTSHQPMSPSTSPTIWVGTPATSPTTATTTTATTTATAISTTATTTIANDVAASLSSWRILHCQQCHLPRRICGQPSCVDQLENNKQHRWTCTSCQQQQGWSRQRKAPPRFFKKARHWSHWI